MFQLVGKIISLSLIGLVILVGLYQTHKPLPPGLDSTSEEFFIPEDSVSFYADKTYIDAEGSRHTEQNIFNEVMAMIGSAEKYILVDMFFMSEWIVFEPRD